MEYICTIAYANEVKTHSIFQGEPGFDKEERILARLLNDVATALGDQNVLWYKIEYKLKERIVLFGKDYRD